VIARAAGHKDDAPRSTDDAEVGAEAAEGDAAGVKVDAPAHGVDDRLGLLVDLLLHKVIEGALHDGGELDHEGLDGAHGRDAVVLAQAMNMEFALGDMGDVVIFEVEDALGVLDWANR
jgi:hypothetical protein